MGVRPSRALRTGKADLMFTTRVPVKMAEVKGIVQAAYPGYRGRRVTLEADETLDVRSYWDGGSRDYFVFVRLADRKTLAMPPQSPYDRQIRGAEVAPIPPGFVCVEKSIFCGKDVGITIHVNPADMPKMLPAAPVPV